MPELPEVETIRLGLQKYLIGNRVDNIEVRFPGIFSGESKKVIGATVQSVRRFGKGLVIDFDNDYSIAIHIKMTGQLIFQGTQVSSGTYDLQKVGGTLPTKHTHVIFWLKKNKEEAKLYYNDIRQFGWMKVVKTQEISELPFFKSLGPEPLKDLTLESFREIVSHAKLPIKNLLMDQKRIAGVGNIYANDALFLARIHPKRSAASLTAEEIEHLFSATETVLRKGIEVGGASEWQYVNAVGETGSYQNFFQVYGKAGKPCPKCGEKIEKITIGGRGTFFCPTCQPQ